jgi:hypothetical protein
MVSESKVLRRIFGFRKDIKGNLGKLHGKEFVLPTKYY